MPGVVAISGIFYDVVFVWMTWFDGQYQPDVMDKASATTCDVL
jgi:hypothetical protein